MNMNREQRRKAGINGDKLVSKGQLNSPCTITEAVQIARGVAEDVITDYNHQQSHLQIAISLQIEILKDVVIKSGLITEEDFRRMYNEKAEEFNKMQKAAYEQAIAEESEVEDILSESESESPTEKVKSPQMTLKSNDVELKVMK